MDNKLIFHKGQKRAFNYMHTVHNPVLFMEMRTGKTLTIVRYIKTISKIKKSLIVAPYSAFNGWVDTLENENQNIVLLTGTKKQRHEKLFLNIYKNVWFIINYQGWIPLPEIKDFDFDFVCLDESIHIANPKSKVSKFFVNNFKSTYKKAILTGDPEPNHKLQLFQQLQFLNPDILPYKDYWDFRSRAFKPDFLGYDFTLTKKSDSILKERLSKYCFYLSRKDCGFDNKKEYVKRVIQFSKPMKNHYSTIIKEFVLASRNDKVIKKSVYALQSFLWARRLCGGFLDDKFVWDGKIKELLYLLNNELKGQKVVVWASFINEQYKILESIKRCKIGLCYVVNGEQSKKDNDVTIKAFQNGRVNYLVAQPSCFKHGVDLSSGDCEIYYSQCNGAETRNQSEDRLAHKNRKQGILIIDLLIESSIEYDYYMSHKLKETEKELYTRIINRIKREKNYA